MKSFKLILAVCLCAAAWSCGRGTPQAPRMESRLVVSVQWDHHGIADRRIQIVETGNELVTDSAGLAEFVLPAGSYTVRAYGINGPGPGFDHVDFEVTLIPVKTFRLEIADCLPCVSPGG